MAKISLAKLTDVGEMEPLCHRAFVQMQYDEPPRCYHYSSEHITMLLERGVKSPDHIVTKYEQDGRIIGLMVVGLTDFNFYSIGLKTAYEIVWHGDPDLPPVGQLRVQLSLLKDMLKRTEQYDIMSLTLDEKHLDIHSIISRMDFVSSTRTLVRRSHNG